MDIVLPNTIRMELEDQMHEIKEKVNTLLMLLQGNPLDKHDDGLFGEIKKMSERLASLESLKTKVIWIMVGMTGPATYGIAKFVTEHYFKLKGL